MVEFQINLIPHNNGIWWTKYGKHVWVNVAGRDCIPNRIRGLTIPVYVSRRERLNTTMLMEDYGNDSPWSFRGWEALQQDLRNRDPAEMLLAPF